MGIQNNIISRIVAEREAQDEQWGGYKHDNRHTNFDWFDIFNKHSSKLPRKMTNWDDEELITQLIKVAAVAVAWSEAIRRQPSKGAPERLEIPEGLSIIANPAVLMLVLTEEIGRNPGVLAACPINHGDQELLRRFYENKK